MMIYCYIFGVCFFVLFLVAFCLCTCDSSVQSIKDCDVRGVIEMSNSSVICGSQDFVGNVCTSDGTVTCTTLRINEVTYLYGEKLEGSVLETCYERLKGIKLGKSGLVSLSTGDLTIRARNTKGINLDKMARKTEQSDFI
jgi:hypothetical protein